MGKADPSKGYWNAKEKLEVTTHFLKSIKIHNNIRHFLQNL